MNLKKPKDNYTVVCNEIINNPEISMKAKGLYCYLFSKPDNWSFSAKRISNQNKESERSIKEYLKELESFGYLERKKLNNGKMIYNIFYKPKCKKAKVQKLHRAKVAPINKKDINNKKDIRQNKFCTREISYEPLNDSPGEPNIPNGKTKKQTLFMVINKLGWHYKKEVKRLVGVDPIFSETAGGKQYTIAKNAIKKIGLDKAKQHCTVYLEDKESREWNTDFSTIFSTAMINKFLPRLKDTNKIRF